MQIVKSAGSHLVMFVAGLLFRPWFTTTRPLSAMQPIATIPAAATMPPVVEPTVAVISPQPVSFDDKMLTFLESLREYFEARIRSMGTRLDRAPILATSIKSAEIALEMIAQMKRDREIIKSFIEKCKLEENAEGEAAANEILKRYYGGFLINLNVILKSNLEIMRLVADVIPIPPHKADRDKMFGMDGQLEMLVTEFTSRRGAGSSYLMYQMKKSVGCEWQETLLNDVLRTVDASYGELLDKLTSPRKYTYQQLMILSNRCTVLTFLLDHKLADLAPKSMGKPTPTVGLAQDVPVSTPDDMSVALRLAAEENKILRSYLDATKAKLQDTKQEIEPKLGQYPEYQIPGAGSAPRFSLAPS